MTEIKEAQPPHLAGCDGGRLHDFVRDGVVEGIQAIRAWLEREFPDYTAVDLTDKRSHVRVFDILGDPPSATLIVSLPFLRETAAQVIIERFDEWQLADKLRVDGEASVVVTARGPEVRKRS